MSLQKSFPVRFLHVSFRSKGDLTSVGVGSNTLKKQTNYAIDNAIPHPNYNNDVSGLNDILLVKTSTDIVTKPGAVSFATINPLSLPEAAAQNVRFAGWGQLHASSSQYPADLYAVNYTLLPPSSCWKKSKQKLLYSSQIQLCASSTGGACWGDNGGPLVAQNGMLIGLESKVMGPTCAAGNPDVFTKVAYYYDWLFDVISNN